MYYIKYWQKSAPQESFIFYFIHFKLNSLNTLPILYNMHQTKEMTANNRKPQNQNKFWSELKTANKIRGDVHAVEVINEAYIFWRETRKTPNRIIAHLKTGFYFRWKTESQCDIEQKLQTTTETKIKKPI